MRSLQGLGLCLAAGFLVVLGHGGCGDAQAPSGLSYANGAAVYTRGVRIAENSPTVGGGAVTAYAVSPALPAGLSIDPDTGVISGTPTAVTAIASHTVTASNSGGRATAIVTITVMEAPPVQLLANLGQQITPLAPRNSRFVPMNPDLVDRPDWLAGQAVTTVVSPDKKTLLVLTSGFNQVFDAITGKGVAQDSNEYVFIYDISTRTPIKKQVVTIRNAYNGIVFDPSGRAFYVPGNDFVLDGDAGLAIDDKVHVFVLGDDARWAEQGPGLALNHKGAGVGLPVENGGPVPINSQVYVRSMPAGVGISEDGKTLVVANYYNDSITVFTGGLGSWSQGTEQDLRPGRSGGKPGTPGGEYPFWVVVKGNGAGATAYVSSIRDREIVVVSLDGAPRVVTRIPVKGQPGKMTLNAAQTLLYVVEDQSDTVDVIATDRNAVVESIAVIAPAAVLPSPLAHYTGANPNSVTLSPDEAQLYVTNGNLNNVAVVALDGTNRGGRVVGLIPTGWYPNSVSFSDGFMEGGKLVYDVHVVNGKSPTGENPGNCYVSGPPILPRHTLSCLRANQYSPQLIKAGLQSFPRPSTEELAALTVQVATNNRFSATETAEDAAVMAAVRAGVKHVIFVIKENRTYDQILGDLEIGNGDPDLAEFGPVTPNQHQLARAFVTLDNFYDSAEVSNDGWPWTTSARTPDVIQRQFPVAYAGRGLSLDSEGTNRSVNVAIKDLAGRRAANPITPDDEDLLPGQTNVAAPDGPDNELNTGYLWDHALRANLTVRNYGFFLDTTLYSSPAPRTAPSISLEHDPFATGTQVAFAASASLEPYTDKYFRGFDNQFPDYYRYTEWARDFDAREAAAQPLAALTLVRFMHDHTGNFGKPGDPGVATDGLVTPELQVADNDYAVGLLVEKIAHSRYANDTLIFIIEDDAQDGGDHVDMHRSVAFVVGAHVKRNALVSTQYNTIDFVRTIEEVLGLPPMNLNDARARPMADIFATTPSPWSFTAAPAAALYASDLPLPPRPSGMIIPRQKHDGAYWARVTEGMDFTNEDRMGFARYNRILWKGIVGHKPYPATPSGIDLRKNRAELLARHRRSLAEIAAAEARPARR